MDIITSIEIAATAIGTDTQEAAELRMVGNHMVNNPKPSKPNVSKQQEVDIRELGKKLVKEKVILTNADKGRATVALNEQDYREKMDVHVISPDMLKLEEDPMEEFRKELMHALEAMKPIMNDITYKKLLPAASKPLRLFRYVKIHKEGNPTRP